MSDDQTTAEDLDDDNLGRAYPPDVPLGLGDLVAQDVLAIGEVGEDSLADRIAREEPEVDGAPTRSRIDEAFLAEGLFDDEPSESSLVSSDDDVVDVRSDGREPFLLADEERAETGDPLAAEDAAMHVIDD